MSLKDDFNDFIIEFRCLVKEVDIVKKYFKKDLYKKLFYLL